MTRAVPPSVVEALTKYGNQMWLLGSGKPDRALAARADLLAAIADAIDARPHDAEFVTRAKYDEMHVDRDIRALEAEQATIRADRLAAKVAAAHGLQARAEAAEARVVELQRALLPFANLGVGSGPGEMQETYKIERNAIRTARVAARND